VTALQVFYREPRDDSHIHSFRFVADFALPTVDILALAREFDLVASWNWTVTDSQVEPPDVVYFQWHVVCVSCSCFNSMPITNAVPHIFESCGPFRTRQPLVAQGSNTLHVLGSYFWMRRPANRHLLCTCHPSLSATLIAGAHGERGHGHRHVRHSVATLAVRQPPHGDAHARGGLLDGRRLCNSCDALLASASGVTSAAYFETSRNNHLCAGIVSPDVAGGRATALLLQVPVVYAAAPCHPLVLRLLMLLQLLCVAFPS
jgi:hypothetical protein